MSQLPEYSIYQKIEDLWKESGALPEFIEAMRLVLPNEGARADPERDPARWSRLPGLCCQAAGGDPGWTEYIATAWFLLYIAAHVFDNLEDQDQPERWREGMGSGEAINVASGLLFSASLALSHLYRSREFGLTAGDICSQFYQSVLKMSAGQHLDLITRQPALKTWFEIAEMKSGTFFALACWSGARLATGDAGRLDGFSRFGSHLGVLLQIHDDLEDLGYVQNQDAKKSLKGITRSLPVAYALEVCPEDVRGRLLASLREADEKESASRDVFDLLDQCGAALYLKIEIEHRQQEARAALESAWPDPSAQEPLYSFLQTLEVNLGPG